MNVFFLYQHLFFYDITDLKFIICFQKHDTVLTLTTTRIPQTYIPVAKGSLTVDNGALGCKSIRSFPCSNDKPKVFIILFNIFTSQSS
jgi:hypothetical protein